LNVYIQHTSSHALYSAKGWVKTILEADAFENTLTALNHCIRENLRDVQIRVAAQGECGHDTIFSVTNFPDRSKAPAMT